MTATTLFAKFANIERYHHLKVSLFAIVKMYVAET